MLLNSGETNFTLAYHTLCFMSFTTIISDINQNVIIFKIVFKMHLGPSEPFL